MTRLTLTSEQRYELQKLWFIYGNYGERHSDAAHGFIQQLLEHGKDCRRFYFGGRVAKQSWQAELLARVDAILTR